MFCARLIKNANRTVLSKHLVPYKRGGHRSNRQQFDNSKQEETVVDSVRQVRS